MFSSIKNIWNISEVTTTLNKAGLNKDDARNITQTLPKEAWALINDCTSNLNSQCKNLCNSMFAASLFQILNRDRLSWELENSIGEVIRNILESVEYQSEMGHKTKIDDSLRRFEYVGEKCYGNR